MPDYLTVSLIATSAAGAVSALLRIFLHHRQAMRRMRLLQHVHDQAPAGWCVQHIHAMAEALARTGDRPAGPAGQMWRRMSGARQRAGAEAGGSTGLPESVVDPVAVRGADRYCATPPRAPGPDNQRTPGAENPVSGAGLPRRRRRADEQPITSSSFPRVDIGLDGKTVPVPARAEPIREFVARSRHFGGDGHR
jgi:hypothetical protein